MPQHIGPIAGYLRGSAATPDEAAWRSALSGGDLPDRGMKPLTRGVSFDVGEKVALGGIARHIVTPYWRLGTLLGRQ